MDNNQSLQWLIHNNSKQRLALENMRAGIRTYAKDHEDEPEWWHALRAQRAVSEALLAAMQTLVDYNTELEDMKEIVAIPPEEEKTL